MPVEVTPDDVIGDVAGGGGEVARRHRRDQYRPQRLAELLRFAFRGDG